MAKRRSSRLQTGPVALPGSPSVLLQQHPLYRGVSQSGALLTPGWSWKGEARAAKPCPPAAPLNEPPLKVTQPSQHRRATSTSAVGHLFSPCHPLEAVSVGGRPEQAELAERGPGVTCLWPSLPAGMSLPLDESLVTFTGAFLVPAGRWGQEDFQPAQKGHPPFWSLASLSSLPEHTARASCRLPGPWVPADHPEVGTGSTWPPGPPPSTVAQRSQREFYEINVHQ